MGFPSCSLVEYYSIDCRFQRFFTSSKERSYYPGKDIPGPGYTKGWIAAIVDIDSSTISYPDNRGLENHNGTGKHCKLSQRS